MHPSVFCDVRNSEKYEYLRHHYDAEKKRYTCLEIVGGEMGSIYIPDQYQMYYRNIFSSPMQGSNRMLGLHQTRNHSPAFTLMVTKASQEPISYRPLVFPENTKKRTQFVLIDLESMLGVLEALPKYMNDIIPHLKAEESAGPVVERTSEFSTMTRSSQARGKYTIKRFVQPHDNSRIKLEMLMEQFASSYCLNLRYSIDEIPGYGTYLTSMLCDWIMAERAALLNAAKTLRMGTSWLSCDSIGSKRKHINDEDSQDLLGDDAECKTPCQSPDSSTRDQGGRKRAKLLPADSNTKDDNMSKKAIGEELDEILGDARMAF